MSDRKGQKELQLIISLIILLVVAVVIISLFLQVFGERPMVGKQAKKKSEIIRTCSSLCQNIKSSNDIDDKRSAIFNYCRKNFKFNPSSGTGTLIKGVYVKGNGENSFCVDKARCFSFDQGKCEAGDLDIGPEICKEVLCKELKTLSKSERKSSIKEIMDKGSCDLTRDTEKEIYVKTWWEKYFKNVDCTGVLEGGGDCAQFCKNKPKPSSPGNYTGAKNGCMTYADALDNCGDPNVPYDGEDAPSGVSFPCTDQVCCCKP